MAKQRVRVLWDKSTLPTDHVSSRLGITRRELGAAIHGIKRASGLRGDDRLVIYENGDVADFRGHLIGNIHDEI